MNRRSFFGFLAGAPLAVAAGKVFAGQASFAVGGTIKPGSLAIFGETAPEAILPRSYFDLVNPQPPINVVGTSQNRQDVEINIRLIEGVRTEFDMIRQRYTVIVECTHGDEQVYDGDSAVHAGEIKNFWRDMAAHAKSGVRTCFGDAVPAVLTDYAMIPAPQPPI